MISTEFHSKSKDFLTFAWLQEISSQWVFIYSTTDVATLGGSPAVLEDVVRKPCSSGTQGTSVVFLLAVNIHPEHVRRAAISFKSGRRNKKSKIKHLQKLIHTTSNLWAGPEGVWVDGRIG